MRPPPEGLPEGPRPEDPGPEKPGGPGEPRRAGPDRTLLAIMAAIAVIVIIALAVVFTRGEPAPLAESTPAGVTQRYAAAVIARFEFFPGAVIGGSLVDRIRAPLGLLVATGLVFGYHFAV